MKNTPIQWTDHTWNVAQGCTKVSEECKYCYMMRNSLNNTRFFATKVTRTKTVFNFPLKIKPGKSKVWDGPQLVFTSSHTDFFHHAIDSYRHEAWNIIKARPDLIFLILTKRPERILANLPPDWGSGYKNVWLGTSVGMQKNMQRAWDLLKVPSACYFLSVEPLLEEVDLNAAELLYLDWRNKATIGTYYDWVIVGGESGNNSGRWRYRPCQTAWIKKIVGQCQQTGTPVFVKQLGTHLAKELKLKSRHGSDINEFPWVLQLRDFPNHLKY